MYNEVVQYSSQPAAVSKLVHADGTAEYRLTRDVLHEKDNDGNDVIQGKEVYFEVPAGQPQPTVEEVEENFDLYWANGLIWPVNNPVPTVEERLEAVEADNLTALEGIAELYEMLMP